MPANNRSSGKSDAGRAVARELDQLKKKVKELALKLEREAITGSVNYARPLELETIAAPVHIVVGEEDTLTPPAMSIAMVHRILGARMTVIENAGHLSNIEQPEAFNRAVLGSLLELSDRA